VKTLIGKHSGRRLVVPSQSELLAAVESADDMGFCIFCGQEAFMIEPDANALECEECNKLGLYGAEQLLLLGLYHADDAA